VENKKERASWGAHREIPTECEYSLGWIVISLANFFLFRDSAPGTKKDCSAVGSFAVVVLRCTAFCCFFVIEWSKSFLLFPNPKGHWCDEGPTICLQAMRIWAGKGDGIRLLSRYVTPNCPQPTYDNPTPVMWLPEQKASTVRLRVTLPFLASKTIERCSFAKWTLQSFNFTEATLWTKDEEDQQR
jgi:hypothetical protein